MIPEHTIDGHNLGDGLGADCGQEAGQLAVDNAGAEIEPDFVVVRGS